jgi:hypothetical protein
MPAKPGDENPGVGRAAGCFERLLTPAADPERVSPRGVRTMGNLGRWIPILLVPFVVACSVASSQSHCERDSQCGDGRNCREGVCVADGQGGGGTGGSGGTGGGGLHVPRFTCSPDSLDFGAITRGRTRTLDVTCRNDSDFDGVLIVSSITGNQADQFRHDHEADDGRVPVARGAAARIQVTFLATRSGVATATLELRNELERVSRVSLRGETINHAVACAPTALEFGFVAPGSEKHAQVVCSNASYDPYQIISLGLDPSSHLRFSWTPNQYPIVVPAAVGDRPGEVRIDVVFRPILHDAGLRLDGILVISTDDATTPRIDVLMTGFAGGPVISCSPARIDFGVVATGLPVTRRFVCANVGTDDPTRSDDGLVVTGLTSSDPAEFTAAVDSPPGQFEPGYGIGATFTIQVTYNPVDEGTDTATIQLLSNAINASAEGPYAVPVSGNGRVLPPCDFELAPEQLRFGNVNQGDSATLEFAIVNHRGDEECLVRDLRLASYCDPAFSLPAGEVSLDVLPPFGRLRYPVRFAPPEYRANAFTCDVLFEISKPADPHQVVPVRGASQEPCALFVPDNLDFGTVMPGCASREREFQIINVCSTPLVLNTIELNAGVSDEFFVRTAPPVGLTLQPGQSGTFTMAYRPEDEGDDTGSVFVFAADTPEPYMATFRGRARLDSIQVDSFEQTDRPKADVLWVIDNSGSMADEQIALANNLRAFLSLARAQRIDYQVGVTTTGLSFPCGNPGGAGGAEDGRLFPVDNSRPRIIRPTTANLDAVWAANVQVGTCQGEEQGLEAAYRALHPPVIDSCDDPRHPEQDDGNCGFLRPEAHLSIIEVTDEPDQSPGAVNYYYTAFLALKGARNTFLFNFNAIAGDPGSGCSGPTGPAEAGDRLADLAGMTDGGVFQSICAPDWSVSLRAISAAAFGFKTCFFLNNRPEDSNGNGQVSDTEGEFEIRFNGQIVGSHGLEGQQFWRYDPDLVAVCFNPLSVPEPGTQIDAEYRTACLAW